MTTSKNRFLSKNKYYNINKGVQDYLFLLPSISLSSKRNFQWDMTVFSIFIAWGKFFIQINIYEIIKDIDSKMTKENMQKLIGVLKSAQLTINPDPEEMKKAIEFINKNPYIMQIIKNGNLSHHYVRTILVQNFYHQSFIKRPVPARVSS